MSPLTTPSIFTSYSVCTTVAWGTSKWGTKFVDEVGFTVFHKNPRWVFANRGPRWTITKADRPLNFTIFHCRMSTKQPARPVCTTSECWHTRCWHFWSSISHKTIPSLMEVVVTQPWFIERSCVIFVSIGVTQVWVMIARIDCEMKWKLQKDLGY